MGLMSVRRMASERRARRIPTTMKTVPQVLSVVGLSMGIALTLESWIECES